MKQTKKIKPNMKQRECARCGFKEYTYYYNTEEYICSVKCKSRPLDEDEK